MKKCSPGCLCEACIPIVWDPTHPVPKVVALFQYVIVRRDVPDIRKVIDVGHASGEAFFLFAKLGLEPAGFDPDKTTLIVKGARNENKLLKLEKELIAKKVPHKLIREPMAPWNGQAMALGLVPGTLEVMSAHVNEFQKLVMGESNEE